MTDKKTKVSRPPKRRTTETTEGRGYEHITPPKPPPKKPSGGSGGSGKK